MGRYGRGSCEGKGVGIVGRVRRGEGVEMQERMGREERVRFEGVRKMRMDWKGLYREEVEREKKDGERSDR